MVNGNINQESNYIEPLIPSGVYEAEHIGEVSQDGNPIVRVHGRSGGVYKGLMKEPRIGQSSYEFKARYQYLNNTNTDNIHVQIIGTDRKGNPKGPYLIVATKRNLYEPKEAEFPFTYDEANSVIVNDRALFSRVVLQKDDGLHFVLSYKESGKRLFGPLFNERHPDEYRRENHDRSGYDRKQYGLHLASNTIRKNIRTGEYLLTWNIGNSRKKTPIFVPLVEFSKQLGIENHNGNDLETRVTTPDGIPIKHKYNRGDILHDIVTPCMFNTDTWGDVVVGNVRKELDSNINSYYDFVWLTEAEDRLGKYVSKAKIINYKDKVIIAERIE